METSIVVAYGGGKVGTPRQSIWQRLMRRFLRGCVEGMLVGTFVLGCYALFGSALGWLFKKVPHNA
jgi:hypothetical protein